MTRPCVRVEKKKNGEGKIPTERRGEGNAAKIKMSAKKGDSGKAQNGGERPSSTISFIGGEKRT